MGLSVETPLSTQTARILVVEDDRKVAAFLGRALTFEGYHVDIASDGDGALQAALARPPDLVLLDIMLPWLDGLEVTRRIRAVLGSVPILMLTARVTVADRVEGLDAGADDYLTKPFALEELLARMRALMRRAATGAPSSSGKLQFADVHLDLDAREVTRGGRRIELRNKELELLAYFMRHPGRVLSRRAILEEVWGYEFLGDSNVIEVTVGHLRQRLEGHGRPRIIQTVRPVGYVLRDEVPTRATSEAGAA